MITFSFTVARPSVTVKADGALPSGITVLTGQSGSCLLYTSFSMNLHRLLTLSLLVRFLKRLNNWLMII